MRFGSRGRGVRYTALRGFRESLLPYVFFGSWPARLWSLVPGATRVETVHRHFRSLPADSQGFRIAFVSDLHLGPTTSVKILENARQIVISAKPDVLLLGGDYVFLEASTERMRYLTQWVASIPARVKLAVMGNHDLWADDEAVMEALHLAGVRVLINEVAALPEPFDGVEVIGIDDQWTGTRIETFQRLDSSNAHTRIGLCHTPEGFPTLAGEQLHLFLAGHTHGGQVSSPWGPIYLPPGKHCRRFHSGFYEENGTSIFISRGVGTSEVPMRLFAPPDVALFDFTEEAETGA